MPITTVQETKTALANTNTEVLPPPVQVAKGSVASLSVPPTQSMQSDILSKIEASVGGLRAYQPLFDTMPEYGVLLGTALATEGFDKAQRRSVKEFLEKVPPVKEKVSELLDAYSNLASRFSEGTVSAEQVSKCLGELNEQMTQFLDKDGARAILDQLLNKKQTQQLKIMAENKDQEIFGVLVKSPERICSIINQQLAAINKVISDGNKGSQVS